MSYFLAKGAGWVSQGMSGCVREQAGVGWNWWGVTRCLGGVDLRAPNLTFRMILPVLSTVTVSLGAFLVAFRFFQNSIAFSIDMRGVIRLRGGRQAG